MKTLFQTIFAVLLFTVSLSSQTNLVKYEINPVFEPALGTWDAGGVGVGTVLFDGTEYKMWYYGHDGSYYLKIGYATSSDGLIWTKPFSNPIFLPGDPGSFDGGGVAMPSIIYENGEYKMWYTGIEFSPIAQWRIGYAASTDGGISWTKFPTPVLDLGSFGEWDDFQIGSCTVIKENSVYKLWYHGGQAYESGYIGYATSLDGINWTKYNDPSTPNPPNAESDPVLEGTTGDWDDTVLQQPNVIVNNSIYEMWYVAQGNLPGLHQEMGFASSSDGINWAKYNDPSTPNPPFAESDPVLRTGNDNEFDDTYLLYPYVILTNNLVYKMWYTGFRTSDNMWRVGYATDSSNVVSVAGEFDRNPEVYSLKQNYPNPFNPKTVIGYQLPVTGNVSIKVYDLLGREVATLIDEYKPAGSYQIEFDASELSSGVYIYRLTTENYSASNKMTLLK